MGFTFKPNSYHQNLIQQRPSELARNLILSAKSLGKSQEMDFLGGLGDVF